MEPVEITTAGLLLRSWCDTDAEAVHRACQDTLIQRWTQVPSPYLPEHAVEFVAATAPAAWAGNHGAPLGVFDAETGELLGANGFVHLDRAAGTAEIGAWTAPWARGRQVAERATRAVARWGLDVLGLRALTWRAQVGNHASRLVAARVGFTFGGPERAAATARDGSLVDCWRGTLLPGEIRSIPPAWYTGDAPGARRARTFAATQPGLPGSGPGSGSGPGTRSQLSLRPLRVDDLAGVVAACTDPESARWTTVPTPYTEADAVAFIRNRAPALWAHGEGAAYAIVDADDRYVGSIDLLISADDPGSATIGYLVAPHARGLGYATAAVRAICRWGLRALGLERIVWRAYLGNTASRRVAEKAGFTVEGIQRGCCTQRGERRDAWVAALLAADCDLGS